MNEARDAARELMQVGRLLDDPRSTGFGLDLLSWIAFAIRFLRRSAGVQRTIIGGRSHSV